MPKLPKSLHNGPAKSRGGVADSCKSLEARCGAPPPARQEVGGRMKGGALVSALDKRVSLVIDEALESCDHFSCCRDGPLWHDLAANVPVPIAVAV